MARTRSSSPEAENVDATEPVPPAAPEVADAQLAVTTTADGGNAGDSPSLPRLQPRLVDDATSSAAVPAPDRPGLVTIRNGIAMRQVHTVDVADWLELGWRLD